MNLKRKILEVVFLVGLMAFSALAEKPIGGDAPGFLVANGAKAQIGVTLKYDPAYLDLTYPGGDVPKEMGVCTDVVVRAFREANVDLQQLVHEDMAKNFGVYPKKWGLRRTDTSIDHRRVLNLMKYFERQGKSAKMSTEAGDYLPGDVVAWTLDNGLDHMGIVGAGRTEDGTRPLIIHNIGQGAQEEDVLFKFKMIGHFRYFVDNGGKS